MSSCDDVDLLAIAACADIGPLGCLAQGIFLVDSENSPTSAIQTMSVLVQLTFLKFKTW